MSVQLVPWPMKLKLRCDTASWSRCCPAWRSSGRHSPVCWSHPVSLRGRQVRAAAPTPDSPDNPVASHIRHPPACVLKAKWKCRRPTHSLSSPLNFGPQSGFCAVSRLYCTGTAQTCVSRDRTCSRWSRLRQTRPAKRHERFKHRSWSQNRARTVGRPGSKVSKTMFLYGVLTSMMAQMSPTHIALIVNDTDKARRDGEARETWSWTEAPAAAAGAPAARAQLILLETLISEVIQLIETTLLFLCVLKKYATDTWGWLLLNEAAFVCF